MSNYFYLKLKDTGYNVKTSPILNNYLNHFTPINIDEDNCINPHIISKILEKYDEKQNVIVFYQHKSASTFKNNLMEYLNNNSINFKFYLFTFDFWYQASIKQFQPKNFKVFTFASSVEQLDFFLNLKGHKKWENNYIFKNIWCSYNESILDINLNPINKLLLSGEYGHPRCRTPYIERRVLHNLSKKNKNIMSLGKNNNDIKSKEFTYNKRLNSYFACFSSSVYMRGKNTHLIVLKTFEILGSGSLLVMPIKEEKYISEIGLLNMENCYLIDFSKDLSPQIDFIFDNIELFNTIRKKGQLHAIKNLNEDKMIREIKDIIES